MVSYSHQRKTPNKKQKNESEELNMYFSILDLLVLGFAVITALALISVCLMFLLKSKTAQRVTFWAATALGAIVAVMGLVIAFTGMLVFDIIIGIIGALAIIGALMLAHADKNKSKLFTAARIMSSFALAIGIYNIFLW